MAAIDEAANEKRMQVDKATAKVLEASNRAVAKICNITNLETDRRSLDAATLQDFAKVPLEDLKSFIMTRNPHFKTRSRIPNKGTVDEARGGVVNAISIAFDCRTKMNCGKYAPTEDGAAMETAETAEAPEQRNDITLYTVQEM